MSRKLSLIKKKIKPPLDDNFQPVILWDRAFLESVKNSGKSVPLLVGFEKENDSITVYKTQIFSNESGFFSLNYQYIERLVKTLLWIYGGHKIIIGGSSEIGKYMRYNDKKEFPGPDSLFKSHSLGRRWFPGLMVICRLVDF